MPVIIAPAIIFGCNALLFVSLFTRLPDLAAHLSLDKGALGTVILCSGIGGVLSTTVAGRIVARLTPPVASIIGIIIMAACVFSMTYASVPVLALLFFIMGANNTILEVAQNLVSLRIEEDTGRKVLARSHGFWSAGMIVGSAISAGMTNAHISPQLHIGAMGVLAIALCCVIVPLFAPRNWPVAAPVETRKRRITLPNKAIFLLCLTIWGLVLLEGAAYDWGVFFLREVNLFSPAVASLVYGAMSVSMFIMRMTGDSLRARVSDGAILRGAAVAGFLAVVLLLVGRSVPVATIAMLLMGVSAAMVFPVAVAIANGRSGLDGGDGIAALSATLTLAHIGVPPLMGFIAEGAGLPFVFGILLLPIALTFVLAPRVAGRS
ncbi:MFS transporter [Ketogulonicigenium robustum]|nr:MFS transporter [Ketogulonicigenium robustum]